MLLDNGRKGGIKRIFTTLNSAFFLHGLLFLDALKYLAVLPPKYTLQRYIQVDIDDIFIGKSGLRLKKTDVKVTIFLYFSVTRRHCGIALVYICMSVRFEFDSWAL